MSSNETENKAIFKKWWFWLIILAIVIVLGFTTIVLIGYGVIKGEIGDLANEIQGIYKEATVYSSAGGNTLFIELRNWNNKNEKQLGQIINVVKTQIKDNKLQSYNKFITLAYLESAGKDEALLIKDTYNLPDFTKDETNSKTYIIFEEYQNLYKTLSDTMEGYTGLFNSIH